MVNIRVNGYNEFHCPVGWTVEEAEEKIRSMFLLAGGGIEKNGETMAGNDRIKTDGEYRFVNFYSHQAANHANSGRRLGIYACGIIVFLGLFLFNVYHLKDIFSDFPKHVIMHEAGKEWFYYIASPTIANSFSAICSFGAIVQCWRGLSSCFGNNAQGLPLNQQEGHRE